MAVCLTGPRHHWVVLGSFTPRSLLRDSELSSIRVKIISLIITLGSRYYFLPEDPLLQMIAHAPEVSEDNLRCSLETLVPTAPANSYHYDIMMGNHVHLSFIQLLPVVLVITKYIELFSDF